MVQRFAIGTARCTILDGLLRYRADLRGIGFVEGFQWLDGSFVEDIEAREGRPPRDIDVVSFAYPPRGMSKTEINRIMDERPDLFDHERCKQGFHCDTSIINLTTSPGGWCSRRAIGMVCFHRRGDALWKGMLQLPMDSDDHSARVMLDRLMHQGEPNAGST